MKRRAALAAILAAVAVAVAGCNDHPGQHCARSHEETETTVICIAYGKYGCTAYMPTTYTATVCDQWAPDNPATVSPAVKP